MYKVVEWRWKFYLISLSSSKGYGKQNFVKRHQLLSMLRKYIEAFGKLNTQYNPEVKGTALIISKETHTHATPWHSYRCNMRRLFFSPFRKTDSELYLFNKDLRGYIIDNIHEYLLSVLFNRIICWICNQLNDGIIIFF